MREVRSDAPRPPVMPAAKHGGEVRDGYPVKQSGSKRLSLTARMVSALGNGVKGGPQAAFARFGLFTQSTARTGARHSRCGNQRLESRVRENRTHGSEGGEAKAFPTPIRGADWVVAERGQVVRVVVGAHRVVEHQRVRGRVRRCGVVGCGGAVAEAQGRRAVRGVDRDSLAHRQSNLVRLPTEDVPGQRRRHRTNEGGTDLQIGGEVYAAERSAAWLLASSIAAPSRLTSLI